MFRSIYNALKQVFQTVLRSSSKAFREVVLIEYPRKGIWAVAFITAKTSGVAAIKLKNKLLMFFTYYAQPYFWFFISSSRKRLD